MEPHPLSHAHVRTESSSNREMAELKQKLLSNVIQNNAELDQRYDADDYHSNESVEDSERKRTQDRVLDVMQFGDCEWVDTANRCCSWKVTLDVMGSYWFTKWPARVFGFLSRNRTHAVCLWLPYMILNACLAFVYPNNPIGLPIQFKTVTIDINSCFNIIIVYICSKVVYRLFHRPMFVTVLLINKNANKCRTRRLMRACTVGWITMGCVFQGFSIFGLIINSHLNFNPTVMIVVVMFNVFVTFLISYALFVWIATSRLVGCLVKYTSKAFMEAVSQKNNSLSKQSTRVTQKQPQTHPMPSKETAPNVMNLAIQKHATLNRIISQFSRTFSPLLFFKILADFSVLLVSVASVIRQNDVVFTMIFILMVSFVLAFLVLIPAAKLTSDFQTMVNTAVELRPWCSTVQERIQVESLIIYLQPFQIYGGVRIFGILVTPDFAARICFLMYSLFAAANLFWMFHLCFGSSVPTCACDSGWGSIH